MTKKDGSGNGLERVGSASRLTAALKNASALARFGRLEPRRGTLYSVPHESTTYRLRCYDVRKSGKTRVPIILVPPLMMSADVFDVSKRISAVDYLTEKGFSVWLVDFGEPAEQEGGLHRDMSDHVVAVNDAIDYVYSQQRKPVHLAGYCQGGIFCNLAVAYRKSKNVGSIITFAAPINLYKNLLPGVSDEVTLKVLESFGSAIPKGVMPSNIPGWASKNLFRMLAPVKQLQSWISLAKMLPDRDAILKGEDQRSFMNDGFVAWPGPAMLEFMRQMLLGNRMVEGGCVIEGQTVSLTDITCPMLAVIGGDDTIARPRSCRGIVEAAPNAEIYQLWLPNAGHLGVLVGGSAMKYSWSTVSEWLSWHSDKADRPKSIEVLDEVGGEDSSADDSQDNFAAAVAKGMFDMGKGFIGTAGDLLGNTQNALTTITNNYSSHINHLSRLQNLGVNSEVGFALSLQEQALKSPNDSYFLYKERAHTYANANERVDNIVRGLISLGVRCGDHVGILMNARPSSLATTLAVNRLGAIGVLLRDKSQLATELKLADVQYLIADPENAQAAANTFDGQAFVLGGFGRSSRELPDGVLDMEQIDLSRVAIPDWYQPSPGKADEVAFISFSRLGNTSHCDRITNRQWALYALGTASTTAMVKGDTVYCWTPLSDPTGMIMAMSASLVAGARICIARKFDVETFWQESRSYGVNIVFYSGSMLRTLVDAPPHKLERGSSIRLFAGAGMSEALGKRVRDRFERANNVEMYFSTRNHAFLASSAAEKSGSGLKTVAGSAEIALVHWDHQNDKPYYDAVGYSCPTPGGTIGMMLVKADDGGGYRDNTHMYNVFEKGDCWQVSGDLFIADEEGNYRFIDRACNLIRTEDDTISTSQIENALAASDDVSVAAAFGVTLEGCDYHIPVVALVLKDKVKLKLQNLTDIINRKLDEKSRPIVIMVRDSLPTTPSQQIQKQLLADRGVKPSVTEKGQTFWFNAKTRKYEALTKATYPRLIRSVGAPAVGKAVSKAVPKRKAGAKKTDATKKSTAIGRRKITKSKPGVKKVAYRPRTETEQNNTDMGIIEASSNRLSDVNANQDPTAVGVVNPETNIH